jgi:Tfp pilus assembly protein PilF
MNARVQKLWQRGMAHFRQGNMEAAQASFDAVLALVPDSAPARFRLSMVRARQGRFFAALDLALQAAGGDPGQAEVLTHLARCYLMCGQPELARAVATKALAMPRDNPTVLDLLGAVMTRLDEQVLAKELFDQAIALDPAQASLFFNRGLAQKQFGQVDAAERDLETCLAMSPEHAKAHWTLANLRTQDLIHNHVQRLRNCLQHSTHATAEDELLALALFKELDDLAEPDAAFVALERGIGSRRDRRIAVRHVHHANVDTLIQLCDENFTATPPQVNDHAAPVFVFGMPRSGVGVLGNLLSRHSKVQHLGSQPVFSRRLSQQLGRDTMQPYDNAAFERCRTLDFKKLGRRYLDAVSPTGGKQLVICETHPMNFQLAAFIAKALPGARMLHMVRDPTDNCLSILGHAGSETEVPSHEAGMLGTYYRDYHRLMQHWHRVLPGRIMDVSYESLIEKPEMMLRVICAFVGIRYGSAMRMGLQLHQQSIGRGRRYIGKLPALAAALAPLERKSRSA